MAYLINNKCIDCDMCVPECPNHAISVVDHRYIIDPEKCTECVGFYEQPTFVNVCPIRCIKKDPSHQETREQLIAKFKALNS